MTYDDTMLETNVMVHRYLYYVLDNPVIHDSVYDKMERRAQELLPATSPVHAVGSSLKESYTPEIEALALEKLQEQT
ncbi:MAG: DNA ligase LigA-related protein [Methylobacter sp.]